MTRRDTWDPAWERAPRMSTVHPQLKDMFGDSQAPGKMQTALFWPPPRLSGCSYVAAEMRAIASQASLSSKSPGST